MIRNRSNDILSHCFDELAVVIIAWVFSDYILTWMVSNYSYSLVCKLCFPFARKTI
jgi:hypothetical protein